MSSKSNINIKDMVHPEFIIQIGGTQRYIYALTNHGNIYKRKTYKYSDEDGNVTDGGWVKVDKPEFGDLE